MTKPWQARIAFIFCITFTQAATVLISKSESNVAFIEKAIVDITAPLVETLSSSTIKKLTMSCKAGSDKQESALFLQDIISRQLLQAGFTVYQKNNDALDVKADSVHTNFLEIVLDEWHFTARKSKEKKLQEQINQEFRVQFRYRVMSSTRQILFTGTRFGTHSKTFTDMKSFQSAQKGQPVFAQATPTFSTQRNNLISTILISGVTGLTIFLIYTLRSQ
ncbi:MAG: hypothetical protein ACE5I1_21570 [bacterium]